MIIRSFKRDKNLTKAFLPEFGMNKIRSLLTAGLGGFLLALIYAPKVKIKYGLFKHLPRYVQAISELYCFLLKEIKQFGK